MLAHARVSLVASSMSCRSGSVTTVSSQSAGLRRIPADRPAEIGFDIPGSWGTPSVRLPCLVDAGRTARTRPLRCSGAAPGDRKARAPTKGLSALNSMGFGLAVYASQCGLPTPHATLASSRWSDTTGRAFHPKGSDDRFQSVNYISSSSPKLAWRNRSDRSAQYFVPETPQSDISVGRFPFQGGLENGPLNWTRRFRFF
jgi:hypothetical protein